jgi:4-hydroxyacetophenone monooxygenase
MADAAEAKTTWNASPFVGEIETITASDDELREILDQAELPPLLPALAYATGDLTILKDHLRPDPLMMAMPQGGLTDEQQAEIKATALEVLARFRDGGCVPASPPDEATTQRIMEFAVGGVEMADYLPLLEEELAHRGEDRRAPQWRKPADVDFSVVVIGAGMSGLLAGHRLQQAGVPFTIIEKNGDVGGTWWENQYPGCRVDNPNHNYSYSFAQRHDWPYHFSTQPVLHKYFTDCADAFGLRDKIRFRTEVVGAEWQESTQTWTVTVRGDGGATETIEANAVISAVGQLNRPNMPNIPGIDTYAGPSWHSARWNHEVDLKGKKVVVIGTGASAMQLIPEIAKEVGELVVFQRTPAWMGPTPEYHEQVPPGLQWLYRHVPAYSEFNRFCIFWRMGDGSIANVTVDPAWEGNGESISEINEFARLMLVEYLKAEFDGRPDLLEACTPHYPLGAKRMIRDNGVWAATLKSPHVRLVTTGIDSINETGVKTADGEQIDADVIIYGTGFQASNFLTPMQVTGRGGLDLHEHWAGDARAYLGATIPSFPNLFCLYGPNTNIVVNGSIIYFSECGVRLIMELLRMVVEGGHRAVDVRKDVHEEFAAKVDAENSRMAWGVSDVNSWYKNAHGHVAQNWPFTLLEYWQRTSQPSADDYDFS